MKLNFLKKKRQRTIRRHLSVAFQLLALLLFVYLVSLPFYPNIKYKLFYEKKLDISEAEARAAIDKQLKLIKKGLEDSGPAADEAAGSEPQGSLPSNKFAVSANRVIIPKIGVNAPIVAGSNSAYGLSQGAWLVPDTSTPDQGGNTVITGHRFKYLPPHNLTFYLFHKLEAGDLVSVVWQGEDYLYRIRETKIVEPEEVSIQDPSTEPILTMFTCHPVYSIDKRLVVISELIEKSGE